MSMPKETALELLADGLLGVLDSQNEDYMAAVHGKDWNSVPEDGDPDEEDFYDPTGYTQWSGLEPPITHPLPVQPVPIDPVPGKSGPPGIVSCNLYELALDLMSALNKFMPDAESMSLDAMRDRITIHIASGGRLGARDAIYLVKMALKEISWKETCTPPESDGSLPDLERWTFRTPETADPDLPPTWKHRILTVKLLHLPIDKGRTDLDPNAWRKRTFAELGLSPDPGYPDIRTDPDMQSLAEKLAGEFDHQIRLNEEEALRAQEEERLHLLETKRLLEEAERAKELEIRIGSFPSEG